MKREVGLKVLKATEIKQKVLDVAGNVPCVLHGTTSAKIAQATKKFTECQMAMSVLWKRLGVTGKDLHLVYKELVTIEYLMANGFERVVDDIIEHTHQFSTLIAYEYVEPKGKDMGINDQKKAEIIMALSNNKDKVHEVRDKITATHDECFGLSAIGVIYKSSTNGQGYEKRSKFEILKAAEVSLKVLKAAEIKHKMVMSVLWKRLGATGKDLHLVYKELVTIEYLVANGFERAIDDIIEHTHQFFALTAF
ncbi:Clathrin interactor EPSIN 1 [Ancistrocladus abbreviatus]